MDDNNIDHNAQSQTGSSQTDQGAAAPADSQQAKTGSQGSQPNAAPTNDNASQGQAAGQAPAASGEGDKGGSDNFSKSQGGFLGSADDKGSAGGTSGGSGQGDSSGSSRDGQDKKDAGDDATKAPETYELKYPDGFSEDKEFMEKAAPILRSLNCSNEQAQALADEVCRAMSRQRAADVEAAAAQYESWKKQLMEDADFGGERFDKSKADALAFVKRFAGSDADSIVEAMDEWGLSAFPPVFKMLARAGRVMAREDGFVSSSSGGKRHLTDEELSRLMFPASLKEDN